MTRISNIGQNIVEICGGDNHTLFLTKDGNILSCGSPDYGVLGVTTQNVLINHIDTIKNVTHISSGDRQSFCIDDTGKIFKISLSIILHRNCQDDLFLLS
ncbi:unknown [Neodiprion lecontei nucleopolyhedrovirus]|uniref:Regulator of chromosome condensation protein n=1 Tax=Neodiprion lecontei nucleopolyhedrovirus (strain Canada) TaxID=654906 RepID=Q6JP96_NPVNC|nr:unknown [Neodiprion lecontei nucleopolyhedrovirus]AAQ99117.1 unknown [Neodiprion lecontei nucleopolyhedrovirus]